VLQTMSRMKSDEVGGQSGKGARSEVCWEACRSGARSLKTAHCLEV